MESVPNLASRVNNWLFMRTFEEKAHETLPLIITVCKAFKESCECDKFLKLLQIVLAVGNYLNGNTSNGRAYGFKLDVMLKVWRICHKFFFQGNIIFFNVNLFEFFIPQQWKFFK